MFRWNWTWQHTKGVKENVTIRKKVLSPGATVFVTMVGFYCFNGFDCTSRHILVNNCKINFINLTIKSGVQKPL